jgi:general secretion pathway protein G
MISEQKSTDTPMHRHGERGFTLLELLVVITIMGLLAYLVVPSVMRQLTGAKQQIAKQGIQSLTTILDLYKLDVGSYPTTEQGLQALVTQPSGVTNWHGPYTKQNKLPDDPWQHPFIYRFPSNRPGHDYDICSAGEKGQTASVGEKDQICNE